MDVKVGDESRLDLKRGGYTVPSFAQLLESRINDTRSQIASVKAETIRVQERINAAV